MLARLLCFFFFCGLSVAQRQQQPLTASKRSPLDGKFRELVEELLEHWHVPGISISVVDGNDTFAEGYGIATFPDEKVTPETLFYIGSTTKSFTAAAVSLLIDDTAQLANPLQWTTPLSSIIRDDFVLPDEYATAHVTLEDALSHRTGMPRHDASYGGPNFTVKDAVRSLRYLPMTGEIRSKWQYCNLMFVAISHAIESITGVWLGDFLRSRIWEPLAMASTYFSLGDARDAVKVGKAALAHGYIWANDTQEFLEEDYMDFPEVSGAGATISNVLDLAKYLRAMMELSPPISTAGHNALRTPRAIVAANLENPLASGPTTYSLGWLVSTYREETMYWHTGGLLGFGSLMLYLPHRRLGVMMMANEVVLSPFVEAILTSELLDELLGIPAESKNRDWRNQDPEAVGKIPRMVWRNATKTLYPNAPEKSIELRLPLEEYTGIYNHPAYRNTTLTLADPDEQLPFVSRSKILHADHVDDRTWPTVFDFQHVSGEFFVVYVSGPKAGGYLSMIYPLRAEFRLGVDGKIKELGIEFEAEEMGNEKIWFQKIE